MFLDFCSSKKNYFLNIIKISSFEILDLFLVLLAFSYFFSKLKMLIISKFTELTGKFKSNSKKYIFCTIILKIKNNLFFLPTHWKKIYLIFIIKFVYILFTFKNIWNQYAVLYPIAMKFKCLYVKNFPKSVTKIPALLKKKKNVFLDTDCPRALSQEALNGLVRYLSLLKISAKLLVSKLKESKLISNSACIIFYLNGHKEYLSFFSDEEDFV